MKNVATDVQIAIESLPKATTPPAAASAVCEGLKPTTPLTPLQNGTLKQAASHVTAANKITENPAGTHMRQEVSRSLQSLEEALKALRAVHSTQHQYTGSSDNPAERPNEGSRAMAAPRHSTRGQVQRRSVAGSEKDLHHRGCTPPRDRTPPKQSWLVGPTQSRATTPPRTVTEHSQAIAEAVAGMVRPHAERSSRVWRASQGGPLGLGAEYRSQSRSTTPPRKRPEDGSALLSGLASMSKTHAARGTAGLPCGGGTMRSAREPPRAAW